MYALDELTLRCLAETSFEKYGPHVAVSFVDEPPMTYSDLKRAVVATAHGLRKRGVKPGDRVAILGENSPQWGTAYLAITCMGAVAVPILPDFHKSEVHHIIRNSGAKVLFVSSKLVHKAEEKRLGALKLLVSLDPIDRRDLPYKVESMVDLMKEGAKETVLPSAKIKEGDLAEILYTSGTTGHSKGVMLSHKNITYNALQALRAIAITPDDTLLSILPMSHSYECTCGFIAPLCGGAKIYYIKGLPTAQTLLPALEEVRPTIVLSVPLIMEKIYKKKVLSEIGEKFLIKDLYKLRPMRKTLNKVVGRRLYKAFGGNLRFICFGGAALSPDVEEFLREADFPYITGYGLTESSPLLTVNPVGEVKFQSCGKAVESVELRIADPDPQTGIGEILARGPNVMQGYYKNPEATRQTLLEGGWLVTGDRGYLDEDGYLYIKGRSKNVIVGPSGENIYPEQIEAKLAESPYVLESLVYERNGRLVAKVHLDYDLLDQEFGLHKMEEEQAARKIQEVLQTLKREVNEKVSTFSRIHDIIEQREPFEMTPTKKIKRYLYVS
ncbi:MAG: AMP-binding protein [candidate division KSB1 bacterium]|nr:AMP-binding protein [candidate division KSB1 bacterium]MDZ7295602.1 AMP-binding protein [candidate division KSB1 bacterium]MDZ7385132.1 AMP-binding protein [candidate division KSB1 bacterium]MDZ7393138.1 AMP-binding protein [candidate division KSB1 bacterium]MDZ7413859.1 AMP-binding protein [candidate division KSB1 bacterium]